MVEVFLKATLAARSQPEDWMDTLPLILLGIRTACKLDISSTSAELVYGTTTHEFFYSSSVACSPYPNDFVSQLKCHLQSIRPKPPQPCHLANHPNIATGHCYALYAFQFSFAKLKYHQTLHTLCNYKSSLALVQSMLIREY